jgi:hypothetical protein
MNIRPGHLGVETSGVYGNKSDDSRDYVDMTLQPHMVGISSQCRIKLLPLARQADHCFGHNTDELLQMSVLEQFEAYGAGVGAMIITPNEARGKLGLAPHADGDKLQNPNTVSNKPGQPGGTKPGAKPPATKDGQDAEADDNGDQLNLAHQGLLDKTVAGVVGVIGEKAQRAAATGAKFVAWLDQKFPAELDTLLTALQPVGACVEAVAPAGDWRPGGFARHNAKDVHFKIGAALQAIASTKSEADLKPAITEYFQTWSDDKCYEPAVNNRAA